MNYQPPRPPKDPAKTEKTWKTVGLISCITAIICVLAVVALMLIFVILPKNEYKGAAESGYHSGSVTPGGTTETASSEDTEEE